MRFLRTLGRWIFRASAALGLAFLLATFTPVDWWWATTLAGPWDDPTGDVLIVLTGSSLDDGTIGLNSYWRALYAARAFRTEHFEQIIISGASAPAMRDFVVSQQVPASAVRVETASLSTRDSATNIAALLAADPARYRNRRLVLLTSDYHMRRSHHAFRRSGVTVLPRPIPDARKAYGSMWTRWSVALELAQETTKLAYYWSRGWL